jgi:hypothetical protein
MLIENGKHPIIPVLARPRALAARLRVWRAEGRWVHTDMEMWTVTRRKVLVEGASKHSIRRDNMISTQLLEKVEAHPGLPAIASASLAPSPSCASGVIDEIDEADKTAPPEQRHSAKRIFARLLDEYGYTERTTSEMLPTVEWSPLAQLGRGR